MDTFVEKILLKWKNTEKHYWIRILHIEKYQKNKCRILENISSDKLIRIKDCLVNQTESKKCSLYSDSFNSDKSP